MEESERRKGTDRRSGKERREHLIDDLYEQAVRKGIVKERRKGEERRQMRRRASDRPKTQVRMQIKKAESEWLSD